MSDSPAEPTIETVLSELRQLRKEIAELPKPDLRSKALLTLDEVAYLLGMSRRTVDGLTNVRSPKPRLKTVRERGCIRVTQQDLDDYVDRLRQEAGLLPIKKAKV